MSYHVKLEAFDGPLDLLLHLVRQAKVDIRDIFVSNITEQYLQAVDQANADMEVASEFLVLAAYLLEIKSRSLLPTPPRDDEQALTADEMARQLVEQLEEYERFRKVSTQLNALQELQRLHYTKLPEELPAPNEELVLVGIPVETLQEAFMQVLARREAEKAPQAQRRIARETLSVEDSMQSILRKLEKQKVIGFSRLFAPQATRQEVITVFIALLELMNRGLVSLAQPNAFMDIEVSKLARDEQD